MSAVADNFLGLEGPAAHINSTSVLVLPVPYEEINGFDTGLLEDFIRAFAQAAQLTVHTHLRYGRSPHHICEATFKALANALGDACTLTGRGGVPSTKGTL